MSDTDLRGRAIRTLAWLGDVEFEREVRYRVARRGDYPTGRLDAVRARIVRAESQAAILDQIRPELDEAERDVVKRAQNATPRAGGRTHRDTGAYRAATALEALVAHLCLGGPAGHRRLQHLLAPEIEAAIDTAWPDTEPLRRG